MAAFMKFRVQLVTELNGEMLTRLNSLPQASDLDLELTVIDSKLDPTEAYDVGSDVTQLAGVAQKGGASLELEDPFTTWSEGPLRYDQLTPELRQLATARQRPDRREHREPRRCPSHRQDDRRRAGPGGFQRRRPSAAGWAAYAIGTIPAADQAALPAAMAGTAQTTYTGIVTPWTVTVHAPPAGPDTSVTVDGMPWPSAGGTAIVPAGEHRIVWSNSPAPGPGLTGFTGELASASISARAMTLALQLPGRHLRRRHSSPGNARRRRSRPGTERHRRPDRGVDPPPTQGHSSGDHRLLSVPSPSPSGPHRAFMVDNCRPARRRRFPRPSRVERMYKLGPRPVVVLLHCADTGGEKEVP